MRKTLKKYFIPHKENNYHPHILHTKRAIFYGGLFVVMKIIVLAFVLFLPLEVFVMPDVLALEQKQIVALINIERVKRGLPTLLENTRLNQSADFKATDMATYEYFSHLGTNNQRLGALLAMVGYQYLAAGENLAMGFSSAQDVVNAWIKSPTHHANLLDREYQETGVGLASGYFNGVPTVYVAQHFGWPDNQAVAVKSADTAPTQPLEPMAKVSNKLTEKKVAAINIQAPREVAVKYDKVNSKVYWGEARGAINLSVLAFISGPVASAQVNINDLTIKLRQENDHYVGQATVSQTADEFFKVIILPSIEIKNINGEIITDAINWNTIKIFSPTPVVKYIKARQSLGWLTNIFSVSKNIYIGFIVFFAIALLLNILIKIKYQHPRVIAQTLGLISLLAYLYII